MSCLLEPTFNYINKIGEVTCKISKLFLFDFIMMYSQTSFYEVLDMLLSCKLVEEFVVYVQLGLRVQMLDCIGTCCVTLITGLLSRPYLAFVERVKTKENLSSLLERERK